MQLAGCSTADPRSTLTIDHSERTFAPVARTSTLTDERLRLIYEGDGFGGEKTMRAKVIRELIDEIRSLRRELELAARPLGDR